MRHLASLYATLSVGVFACGTEERPTGPSAEKVEPLAAATYAVVDLGTLGGDRSVATDINQAGVVVGWSAAVPGDLSSQHAFRWKGGVMTDLGTLGGPRSAANAINPDGVIVGWSISISGNQRAVRWMDGRIRNLGTLGGLNSEALDISPLGVIVGWAETASGAKHAFMWKNGVMTDLGTLGGSFSAARSINRAGVIVGISTAASNKNHAFRWKDGVMRDLGTMGRLSSSANDINNQGQIVGSVGPFPDAVGEELEMTDWFRWQNGSALVTRSGHYWESTAEAINANGVIAGTDQEFSEEGDFSNAFVWEQGRVTVLDALSGDPGQFLAGAHGINTSGHVVGFLGPLAGGLSDIRATMWRRVE
jgi:probable HAF family extracellular repeat protein